MRSLTQNTESEESCSMSDQRYGPNRAKDAEEADRAGRELVKILIAVTFCDHCQCRKATCFGSYEGRPASFACDECCGHGCEDGRCVPFDGDPNGELAVGEEA